MWPAIPRPGPGGRAAAAGALLLELDARRLRDPPAAASIGGAAKAGRAVDPVSCRTSTSLFAGSVAVSRTGARVGKGGGYSDLEYALCRAVGCLDTDTRTGHLTEEIRKNVPVLRSLGLI
jgi:5-formyltetrahydrofolate cyclo-ligase